MALSVLHEIRSDPFSVRAGLKSILEQLSTADLATDQLDRLQIVLAEVLNNIVKHGQLLESTSSISVAVSVKLTGIQCIVRDRGKPLPFHLCDPDSQVKEAISKSLPEGGFGWPLIRNLTSSLTADRIDDANVLSFEIEASKA